MELSKDEPIFKLIEELKMNLKDNEVFVKFHNNVEWTEAEFNNFINVMRNNYKETIEDECLEVPQEVVVNHHHYLGGPTPTRI